MVRFLKDSSGATAIEYALIASLISVVIITTIILVGNSLTQSYSKVGSQINSATNK